MKQTMYTSIDLFCGPGGLATGFHWAGINPLIAVEWSPTTAETYAKNHNADILILSDYLQNPQDFSECFKTNNKTLLIQGDINLVTDDLIRRILKERFNKHTVDIVSGGAPCESFSMAGDRKEEDDRNELFENILRISRAVDATMFLFENVKGLFSKKYNGKTGAMYEYLCSRFESIERKKTSYRLASKDKNTVLLKAVDYGVPQLRERVFLVGINNKYPKIHFSYPSPTHGKGLDMRYISVRDAIMDLPQIEKGETSNIYSYSKKETITSSTTPWLLYQAP